MADKSSRKELISGLLDDQLTPQERAEAEALMREPENEQMLSELRDQSEQLRRLPKFGLGGGFVDRLMASAEVNDAFDGVKNDAVKLHSERHQTYKKSGRFGGAIAAIASLAALVLVTLFVPQPLSKIADVAQALPKSPVKSKRGSDVDVDAKLDFKLEGMVDIGDEEMLEQLERVRDQLGEANEIDDDEVLKKTPELIVASRDNKKPNLTELNADSLSEFQQRGLQADRGRRYREKEDKGPGSASAIRGFRPATKSLQSPPVAGGRITKEKKSIDNVSRALAQKQASAAESDMAVGDDRDVGQAPAEQIRALAPMRGGGGIGGGARDDFDDMSKLTRRPEAVAGIRDIVAVNYEDGTEMLSSFRDSLKRNSFGFEMVDDLSDKAKVGRELIASVGQSEVFFEITATPKQVARLVQDLGKNAVVMSLIPQQLVESAKEIREAKKTPGFQKELSRKKDPNVGFSLEVKGGSSEAEAVEQPGKDLEAARGVTRTPFAKGVKPKRFSADPQDREQRYDDQQQLGYDAFLYSEQVDNGMSRYLFIVRMNDNQNLPNESVDNSSKETIPPAATKKNR